MKKVLLTRPQADSEELAALLQERGYETIMAPLLEIEPAKHNIEKLGQMLSGLQAIVITSKNAATVLSQVNAVKSLPLITVGKRTAESARQLGFIHAKAGGADVMEALAYIEKHLSPAAGKLLYLSGDKVSSQVNPFGFEVERLVVYKSLPVELKPEAVQAIVKNQIKSVMIFSPRTARHLIEQIRKNELASAIADVNLVVLSAKVAKAVEDLKCKSVVIAETPTLTSMLEGLDIADGKVI